MSEAPESAAEALARHAAATPERPFLFFRSARGTFTWWSYERCRQELAAPQAATVDPVEAVPRDFLDAAARTEPPAAAAAAALARLLGPNAERDIWISARALEQRAEAALAVAALRQGWAVVREPGAGTGAELFAWVRPTVLAGSAAELIELARGFTALAPRFGRRRFWRRRLTRLRAILVEGGESVDAVAGAFAAVGSTAGVLPFPDRGW